MKTKKYYFGTAFKKTSISNTKLYISNDKVNLKDFLSINGKNLLEYFDLEKKQLDFIDNNSLDKLDNKMFNLTKIKLFQLINFFNFFYSLKKIFFQIFDKYNIFFKTIVKGGGKVSRLDSIIYSIFNCLFEISKDMLNNEDIQKIKNQSRKIGLYTVDIRKKRRKLAGKFKSRAKEQFSKR